MSKRWIVELVNATWDGGASSSPVFPFSSAFAPGNDNRDVTHDRLHCTMMWGGRGHSLLSARFAGIMGTT
jgi:hypothetical protein